MNILAVGVCATAWVCASPPAFSQSSRYPQRPVTLYVGFSAGSATDSAARTMASLLAESRGQQFVIVNRDGAAGVTAANAVAKAKPDGRYALLAPAGTPTEIVALPYRSFVKAMEHAGVKANIAQEGALAGGITPEPFCAFIRSELVKFTTLVKDARIAPES